MVKALTEKSIPKLKPGRHRDRETRGLYLQVGPNGNKSWLFRFEFVGREHFLGLGSLQDFKLKEARERARKQRQLLADGINPLQQKKQTKQAEILKAAKSISFKECAESYYTFHEEKWSSDKWRSQFKNTLRDYVYDKIGHLPVADIDTGLVLRCIEPIWKDKTPTADRVRRRIQAVLDYATVRNYRTGENPARWEGHLQHILPKTGELTKVEHHPALPYATMPAFMEKLRAEEGIDARLLEMVVLTALRSGEATAGLWSEIDFDKKTWTVPASRMKASKTDHRVPLSDRAIQILKALPRERGNDFIFVGSRADHITSSAMDRLLKRLGYKAEGNKITVHGFRSSFRDWAGETTAYPNHVLEMALGHTIGNAVEAAYRRGDLFAKRAKLMGDWSKYCSSKPLKATGDNVVALRGK